MNTHRKKPVEVAAIVVSDAIGYARDNWEGLPAWLQSAYEEGNVVFLYDHVLIRTLEGEMKADFHDWIIRGVKDEIYACKPDIFDVTYEAIDTDLKGKST